MEHDEFFERIGWIAILVAYIAIVIVVVLGSAYGSIWLVKEIIELL